MGWSLPCSHASMPDRLPSASAWAALLTNVPDNPSNRHHHFSMSRGQIGANLERPLCFLYFLLYFCSLQATMHRYLIQGC